MSDTGESQAQQSPGSNSAPEGQSPDYAEPGAGARTSANPPPDTNQPSTEPMPATEGLSAPDPGNISSCNAQSPSAVTARTGPEAGPDEHGHGGDPGTGNAHGVSVPHTDTMPGTSQDESPQAPAVGRPDTRATADGPTGVARPARPAAPDGEVSP